MPSDFFKMLIEILVKAKKTKLLAITKSSGIKQELCLLNLNGKKHELNLTLEIG